MKVNYSFFLLILLFLTSSLLFGEGSKQLNTGCIGNQSTDLYLCNNFTTHCNGSGGIRSQFAVYNSTQSAGVTDRLYFVTLANEVVYLGFKGTPSSGHIVFRIMNDNGDITYPEQNLPTSGTGFISGLSNACNGPNQLLSPPANTGYDAIAWTPPLPGTYFIEFSQKNNSNNFIYDQFNIDLFDITIYNPVTSLVMPGRLYSKSWQFSESSNFTGQNYVMSDDGIVTSIQFNNMDGGAWVQYANQTGCGTTDWMEDRKSLYNFQAIFPQYKVFLNSPDPNVFPIATTLGQIIPPEPAGTRFCDGHIEFIVNVDKAANVEITLNFSPGTYVSRVLNQAVDVGANSIYWDGLDGTLPTGVPVPNNIVISFSVSYINGLTNLPLYDVEGNMSGFLVQLVAPAGAAPNIFWDDSKIWQHTPNSADVMTNVATTGCPSPATFPGCHKWPSSGGGWGDHNTINSWWYTVSTSVTYAPISQWRNPGPLVFNQSAQTICAGTNNVTFSVTPDVNTEQYIWNYTGTGATIIQGTPADPFVTVSFAANATSGNITVFGTNTNCNTTPSPTKTLTITIQPIPDLTSSLTYGTCSGVAFSIPLISSPPGASFSWTTPAPTCSANVASCPPGATGTTLTDNLSVTNLSQGTVTYHVTPISSGCNGVTKDLVVTVDPKPNITSPSTLSENLCSGGTTNIVLQSGLAGATINWQVLPGGCTNIVTCPGSGSASPISNLLTLTSNSSPGTVVYTITPNVGGCFGDAVTHTVHVLQLPPVVLTQFIPVCLNTPAFTLTGGAPTGGTYTLNGTPITTFNPATAGAGTYHILYTFTDANGCTASDAKDLLVQSLITPNLLGNASACLGVTESFTTDPGMIPASYAWTVSPDGTKVAGANPWEVTITWNSTGTKTIGVTYTDPNGCTTTPGSKNVTVNPLPTPSLVAPDVNVCNNRSYTYTTQPGMTGGYTWVVSNPAINVLTPSGNTATVLWNAISPAEWIRVNYVNANGCTAVAPTSYTVNVNPTPLYIVTGSGSVCAGSTSAYQLQGTEKGNWSITSGGSIVTPVNNVNAISVSWTSGTVAASSSINVTYTNTLGCPGTTNTHVDIQPLPITTFTSSTPSPVCQDYPTPSLYTMDAGAPATYLWQVSPASMAVIADATANPAAITWKLTGTTPQTAQLSVIATTSATTPACSATSSPVTITINPKPNSLMTPCFDLVTSRSAKRFMLKGGTPLLTATPLQGEYLISPATTALSFDGTNYWLDPSLVSGNLPTTFDISYKYTSARYGCPATSTPVILSVLGLNPTCGSTLTDPRDGISYRTSSSLVPGKCWMVENIRYGQPPPTSTSPQTDNCIVERNCLSSDPNCVAYGGLYQWDELIQYGMTDGPAYQGVCPPGWHIPSSAEWQALIDAVVNLAGVPGDGLAGSYLKDQNLSNGFDALVNGIYYLDNTWAYTTGSVTGTMFWTSTPDATYTDRMVVRGVNNINYSVSKYPASRANAFPVRCVKD